MGERSEEVLLVLKAQAGSDKAFGMLYRSYHASLVRFAFRFCRNEQIALDAVQDAWITIARTLDALNEPSMFRPRVFQAVRWRTIDLMRKRETSMLSLEDNMIGASVEESSRWATTGQIATLIGKLPDIEQQAIHLFYLEDMKLNEISAVLEVPIGTLKSRLNRARLRLREIMEGEENGVD